MKDEIIDKIIQVFYIVGAIAVLFLMIAGLKTLGSWEESQTIEKNYPDVETEGFITCFIKDTDKKLSCHEFLDRMRDKEVDDFMESRE